MIESQLPRSTTSAPAPTPRKLGLWVLSLLAAVSPPPLAGDPWELRGTDHIEGTLTVTPVVSRAMDGPMFRVEITNEGPEEFEAWLLTTRIGMVLDGVELQPLGYRWPGIVPMIEPGESYGLTFGIGSFLPGARRDAYSERLGRWRWEIPLAGGRHRVRFFLRKDRARDSERIYSDETELIWDDQQPLLYSDEPRDLRR